MTAPLRIVPGDAPPDDSPRHFHYTDTGNAERLVHQHGQNLRYVPKWDRWLLWDSKRCQDVVVLAIHALAKDTVRSMKVDLEAIEDRAKKKDLFNHMLKSESAPRLRAMVERARSEPGMPIQVDDLNRDPWSLVVANGTLDLRTATLREHARDDLNTKLCPAVYDPEARCDQWEAFLAKVFGGNDAIIRFVQRAVGYSLTGLMSEQCLFFLYGSGANGKSTFLEILRLLLSEYATQADFSTFIEQKGSGPRNDVARLLGARLVTSVEVGEGRRLNESLVKSLTGGDVVAARFLYAETFEFRPTFKLWLAANHKPTIRGTDLGIWRRLRMVPFTVEIPESERVKQEELIARFRAELSGILAWAVAGCMLWQRDGLQPPPEVTVATDDYRRESDTLGAFIDECCVVDPNAAVASTPLYQAYSKWADDGGEFKYSQSKFSRELAQRGFVPEKRGSGSSRLKWLVGLRLSEFLDRLPSENRPTSSNRPDAHKSPPQGDLYAKD